MSGILASFSRGGTLPELLLNITNTASPNIPTLLANAGWKGVRQPVRLLNTALVNTLVIPSSLAGADITIENRSGARIGGSKNAGTALRTQVPIKVDNQGIISGGGGRGEKGPNRTLSYTYPNGNTVTVVGYGGAGGEGEGFNSSNSLTIVPPQPGNPGNWSNFIENQEGALERVQGWPGGHGGSWGTSGQMTQNGGGVPGYYINGNSLVTWINTGTRLGRVKA